MDTDRFDALAKALGAGVDRRRALGGLLAAVLALRGAPDEAAAHNTKARCRELADPDKRRACLAKARRHARSHEGPGCVPEPRETTCGPDGCGLKRNNCGDAVGCGGCAGGTACVDGTCRAGRTVIAASCPGPGDPEQTVAGERRRGQTFRAGASGRLVRAEILADRPGGTDFVVEIRAVDAAGVPTGTVLAATTVTGPTGPGDEVTLVAAFAEPAVVATGERYALSLTVGPGQDFALPSRTGNPCEGQAFLDESADGRFEVSPTADHVYTVFVAE